MTDFYSTHNVVRRFPIVSVAARPERKAEWVFVPSVDAPLVPMRQRSEPNEWQPTEFKNIILLGTEGKRLAPPPTELLHPTRGRQTLTDVHQTAGPAEQFNSSQFIDPDNVTVDVGPADPQIGDGMYGTASSMWAVRKFSTETGRSVITQDDVEAGKLTEPGYTHSQAEFKNQVFPDMSFEAYDSQGPAGNIEGLQPLAGLPEIKAIPGGKWFIDLNVSPQDKAQGVEAYFGIAKDKSPDPAS